jgi:hypothetical protein
LQVCINAALTLVGLNLGIVYFVYDGALGNNAGLQAVIQTGLHPSLSESALINRTPKRAPDDPYLN